MKKVSILSPCYNEELNIIPLYERITKTMEQFPQYDYEIIMIDNCSQDGTVDVLRDIAAQDKKFKVILNAKNFGTDRSGLFVRRFFSGDCMVTLASDLQDPPELIADFLRHWEQGKKVVVAVKVGSEEKWPMRAIRKLYYRIVNAISSVDHIKDFSGFALLDRSIVEPLTGCFDVTMYYRGLISEFGYDVAKVEFVKPNRIHGKSKHSFFTNFDIFMTAVTSYSKLPIRIATLGGLFLSALSFVVAVVYFVLRLFWWPNPPWGIGPLLVGQFFFASVQLLFLGLIGEYVAAIFVKIKPKPLVSVR